MIFMYGRANGIGERAARLYRERFPNRRHPNRKTFERLFRRLSETGSIISRYSDQGRPRTLRPDVEERILINVGDNPRISTRSLAAQHGISHNTVWRLLREQQLHPYHLQRVQGLTPGDYAPRVTFCRWLLQQADNPTFLTKILFTDEATFARNGITNYHNDHLWAEENPHGRIITRHQQQFKINVWAGIIGDYLIGPFLLPHRLTGDGYRIFLETTLADALDNLPLAVTRGMWFMHDGAPAHFSQTVRTILNNEYRNRWIGRGGPVPWPPRSPDLNPLDYYIWGHMKSLVYVTNVPNVDTLRQRVNNAFIHIRGQAGVLDRVRQSMLRRITACIDANGSHFEHFL